MDPEDLIGHRFPQSQFQYSERDAALYALAVGSSGGITFSRALSSAEAGLSGSEPHRSEDPTPTPWGPRLTVVTVKADTELQFSAPKIISSEFRVLPTFAVLFPSSILDQILTLESLKFDPAQLLHGEQHLELFTPVLPSSAKVTNESWIANVQDKVKSVIVDVVTETRDASSHQPLSVNRSVIVLRGAEGFKNKDSQGSRRRRQSPKETLPLPLQAPTSAPKWTVSQKIPETQALLYRLCGDYNPLHADPSFAAEAGFPQPILHGLCTLGFACRALLLSCASPNTGPERALRRLRCRFLSHVFPGEILTTKIWVADESGDTIRATMLTFVTRNAQEVLVLSAAADLASVHVALLWEPATSRL